MKKEQKLLILIFIFAFLIRLAFVFSSPVKWWDETVYANLGYDLSRGLNYSFDHGWSDFSQDWPKAGFRAPLLPIFLALLYFMKLQALAEFFIPFIGALSVILIYYLGNKLFNKQIGLYSALFLALIPLHVYYSAKILTDVFSTFFIILTFLAFWIGYEEDNKKYKILFGVFLALSILSRYTALWIIIIFLIYFLIKDRSFIFLKDRYLWYSVIAFFLVLAPWLIYGIQAYSNPIGPFLHGFKASSYWGGSQPWYFFFQYSWQMLSTILILFVFSIMYLLYKKDFKRKEIYFLFIGIIFLFGMAILMPHKEDRYILPIIPFICLLCGFFISKIRRYQNLIILLIVVTLIFSLYSGFKLDYSKSYTADNLCFIEANKFIKSVSYNTLIITDDSPIVYYYTRKETHFYPKPLTIESVKNLAILYDKKVYLLSNLNFGFEQAFNCKNRTILYQVN